MAIDIHTISVGKTSVTARKDRILTWLLPQQSYPAGNGDPASVAAGSPGAGYTAVPTAAFANAGTGSGATVAAVMGVAVTPTIAAAGTGGTTGTQTVTGTTGTGTKFQASVTIAGGLITAVNSVSVKGAYTVLPTTLAAEPVTGGGLTGAQLNLTGCMGVVSYTVAGSSNHQYAQGTTVTLSGGGSPTTPAVPGAVTVTPVAGQGATFAVALNLPATYAVYFGDLGVAGDAYVTSRTQAGFTVNIAPASSSQTLAAGKIDMKIEA